MEGGGDGKVRERVGVVTLLTNEDYVMGAQALLNSLRKWHPTVDVVVLVTKQVGKTSRFKLKKQCRVVEVEALANPFASECHVAGWAQAGFTKLRIWELDDVFDRVVYIDADCIVVEPIDRLFELNLGELGLAAAPDLMPPDKFNAGVLVLKPDKSVFEKMMLTLQDKDTRQSHDNGDTGFLNAFFPGWFQSPPDNRLPFAFNAQKLVYTMSLKSSSAKYWDVCQPVKIIHFSSSPKPWAADASRDMLDLLWWKAIHQKADFLT